MSIKASTNNITDNKALKALLNSSLAAGDDVSLVASFNEIDSNFVGISVKE